MNYINNLKVEFIQMSKTIRIKYASSTTPRLGQVDKAVSEWVDLYTEHDITIPAFKAGMVDLGVAMKLPDGYEAIVAARSSLFNRYHVMLTNGIGVIDNAYSGDNDFWKANLLALEDTFIPAGTRVVQFRVLPTMLNTGDDLLFEEADHLSDISRGGFGSTGDR